MEGTPAFVHTGPFGNIAHGNCSIISDAIALRCADFVVTEAGFGSDLGAEKFFNIKCRASGFAPTVAVVVATLRALKLHGGGGVAKAGVPLPSSLTGPNREALSKGIANLEQHVANVLAHGVPVVVAVNAFKDDPQDELDWVREQSLKMGARMRQYQLTGPTEERERNSWQPPSSRHLKDRLNSNICMNCPGRSGKRSKPSRPACTEPPESRSNRRPNDKSKLRGDGVRRLTHLHGQNAAVAVTRSHSEGATNRIYCADTRIADSGWGGIRHRRLFRDSADAGIAEEAGR